MASSEHVGVVGILKETIKVIAKSRHSMTIIAAISVLLNFVHIFATLLLTKPVLANLFRKGIIMLHRNPQISEFLGLLLELKHDAWYLLAIQSTTHFVSFLDFLFINAAIILVIFTAYKGKSLSFQELIYRLATSFFKPFITSLYTRMFSKGYMFSALTVVVLVSFSVNDIAALKAVPIVVGIVAVLLLIYLCVVWVMGFVVSVIEVNCYGIEALGKASRLVEGKRLSGYLLYFIATLGFPSMFLCYKMFETAAKSIPAQIIFGFLLSVISSVMQIFLYSTYTVFYCQCEGMKCGEEVELKGSLEYSKVPSCYIPLLSEDIP